MERMPAALTVMDQHCPASDGCFVDVCIANECLPRAARSKSDSPGLGLQETASIGYIGTNNRKGPPQHTLAANTSKQVVTPAE